MTLQVNADRATPPELIVMLTQFDRTVPDALEIFNSCVSDDHVGHWGFKDVGLESGDMRKLGAAMKDAGCTVYMEIVSPSTAHALSAIDSAVAASVDVVMGSRYSLEVQRAVQERGLRYFPFIGEVSSHPNILGGSIDSMIDEVNALGEAGVDGIDLLTFRYTDGDPKKLLAGIAAASSVPIVSAGSIDRLDRIHAVWDAGAWGLTIGTALFEKRFDSDGSFRSNLNTVRSWIEAETANRGSSAQ